MVKEAVLKVITCIFTFVITVYLCSFFMNRDNVNTTKDMDRARLPVVFVNYNGEVINDLYGYTEKMNSALLRENITPLDENRGVSFRAEKYGQEITGVTARVRAIDESRLIEVVEPAEVTEDDYYVSFNVAFKDLIEEYTEYSLEVELKLGDGSIAYYYTRIIDAPLYCGREKLNFITMFDKAKWSSTDIDSLKHYMESNYLGDNTSFEYLNIHSSMDQLAFGNLKMSQKTDTIISIKELNKETAVFTSNYIAESRVENKTKQYFINEFYRIKYTPEEIYLLEYERTMSEIHIESEEMVRQSDILLGITNEDIEIVESDDGASFAFSENGRLYYFNIRENKLAELFSFYNKGNFDLRTYHDDYEVKPLNVDETGNVWFLVYGHMNRGNYEGRVGMALYQYNGVTNVNEEKFFIGTDKSAEMLISDINELCYMSPSGTFYVMLDDSIYAIDVETEESKIVVENLEEDKYTTSADSSMLVWIDGSDVNAAKKLYVLDLNSKEKSEISAGVAEYIKPLTFMGTDLVYGIAKRNDVLVENTGRTLFPMYKLIIQSKQGVKLKEYEKEGVYVSSVSVKENLITLNRVEKASEEILSYTSTDSDSIANNQEQNELQNVIDKFANGDYKVCTRIYLKKDTQGKTITLTPREVIYEGNKEISLQGSENSKSHYYVYYKGKLQNVYTNPALAVIEANENYGTVLNDKGYYIWYRANRLAKNQIMSMTTNEIVEDKESLSVCLDRIMDYEGMVRNSSYLLGRGESVLSILESNLENCNVLDLTGCTLDSVLYYVNRDYPVLAILNDGSAQLIIGYNSLSVVVVDCNEGTKKIGLNEATDLYTKNGNKFISYIHNY